MGDQYFVQGLTVPNGLKILLLELPAGGSIETAKGSRVSGPLHSFSVQQEEMVHV